VLSVPLSSQLSGFATDFIHAVHHG